MSRTAHARPEAASFQRTLLTMLMLSTLAVSMGSPRLAVTPWRVPVRT